MVVPVVSILEGTAKLQKFAGGHLCKRGRECMRLKFHEPTYLCVYRFVCLSDYPSESTTTHAAACCISFRAYDMLVGNHPKISELVF